MITVVQSRTYVVSCIVYNYKSNISMYVIAQQFWPDALPAATNDSELNPGRFASGRKSSP